MTFPDPFVTIIISARPDQKEVASVNAARSLKYPSGKLEILLARGTHPSVQRNTAMLEARGEWIYFLDDDSIPDPSNLQRAAQYCAQPEVMMVGGPNICPPDAPALEKAFAATMANKVAFGPSCARYDQIGQLRATSEKELILCNLLTRKKPLLDLGGFDPSLYPNEENALMDDLQAQGGTLLYDPGFFVYRRPRRTWSAFCRMLKTYGRGRAEQFRLHPTWGSALNFVPPLFLLYLLILPFAPCWLRWPLAGYALLLFQQGIALMMQRRPLLTVPLIALTHLLYGYGFWRGLLSPLRHDPQSQPPAVTLERITIP